MTTAIYLHDIYSCKNAIQNIRNPGDEIITPSPEIFFKFKKSFKCTLLECEPETYASTALNFQIAHNNALNADREISNLKNKILNLETTTVGWHYLNLRYILSEYKKIDDLKKPIHRAISEISAIVIPFVEDPQDYYFPSYINTISLVKILSTTNTKISGIRSTSNLFNANAFSYLPDPSQLKQIENLEALVHMPTAFYEKDNYKMHIVNKHKDSAIDLCSPYFDTKILEKRLLLNSDSDQNDILNSKSFQIYLDKLNNLLITFFEENNILKLPIEIFSSTINRIIQRDKIQYQLYRLLKDHKCFKNISNIYLTDHEAGFHGPLISWAAECNRSVDIFPHSFVCAGPMPTTYETTWNRILRDPGGTLALGMHKGNSIYMPQQSNMKKNGKNILIVLNELTIWHMNINEFYNSLWESVGNLQKFGFTVKLREKPTHNVKLTNDSNLVATGTLLENAKWADIAISFGEPTSALLRCYYEGCKCFHLAQHTLSFNDHFLLPHDGVNLLRSSSINLLWKELFFHLGIGGSH